MRWMDYVGKSFNAWCDKTHAPGEFVAESYDSSHGFWMVHVLADGTECCRHDCSERVIGRTYHEVYSVEVVLPVVGDRVHVGLAAHAWRAGTYRGVEDTKYGSWARVEWDDGTMGIVHPDRAIVVSPSAGRSAERVQETCKS